MGGEPQPANIILELRSSPFLRTERSSWTCHRIVPVVIDLFASGRPVKGGPACRFRRTFQPVRGYPGPIAAKPSVGFQRVPGERVMIVADAENSAETQHGV